MKIRLNRNQRNQRSTSINKLITGDCSPLISTDLSISQGKIELRKWGKSCAKKIVQDSARRCIIFVSRCDDVSDEGLERREDTRCGGWHGDAVHAERVGWISVSCLERISFSLDEHKRRLAINLASNGSFPKSIDFAFIFFLFLLRRTLSFSFYYFSYLVIISLPFVFV